MEAPEKINVLLYEEPLSTGYIGSAWVGEPIGLKGETEYTRTDAFIEKACEYLNKTCRKFILTEKDIEDFKNYMKGE